MTVREKRREVYNYCASRFCNGCKLNKSDYWVHTCYNRDNDCECLSIGEATEGELDKALELIDYEPSKCEGTQASQEPTVDMVNRPPHYCREDGMECIDEMVLVFGKEAVKNFCLCNVWKYRYRASDKNGEEDLKKSDWYMRKYKELVEG